MRIIVPIRISRFEILSFILAGLVLFSGCTIQASTQQPAQPLAAAPSDSSTSDEPETGLPDPVETQVKGTNQSFSIEEALPIIESKAHPVEIHRYEGNVNWHFTVTNGQYITIWPAGLGENDLEDSITIANLENKQVIATYHSQDDKRYVGKALMFPDQVLVTENIPFTMDQGPEVHAYLRWIDLLDGSIQTVVPPEGYQWAMFVDLVHQVESYVLAVVDDLERSEQCIVRIDYLDAEILHCYVGRATAFSTVAEGGATYVSFDQEGTYNDSRELIHVPVDGGPVRHMTYGHGTDRVFVGTVMGGWDFWHEPSEEDPAYYRETALWASNSVSARSLIGTGSAGSLVQCDGYVYWWEDPYEWFKEYGIEGESLLRYKPGADHVELLYTTDNDMISAGGSKCQDGYLTFEARDRSGPVGWVNDTIIYMIAPDEQ